MESCDTCVVTWRCGISHIIGPMHKIVSEAKVEGLNSANAVHSYFLASLIIQAFSKAELWRNCVFHVQYWYN